MADIGREPSGNSSDYLIRASSVGVQFPGQPPVLSDVDFSLATGEFVSVVGPSGCGKTTILRLIAQLQTPTRGQLEINGDPRMAVVFQEPNLLPWRTVVGNIRLPLELLRISRVEQDAAVAASLETIELAATDYQKFPRMLSGGMKMRVALARALVTNPSVLLLDEPFAALDDMLRQLLNEELLKIWASQRLTALFVTHNVAEAVFLSSRILLMAAGPGSVFASVEVPFEYPRSPSIRGSHAFTTLTHEISQRLRDAQ